MCHYVHKKSHSVSEPYQLYQTQQMVDGVYNYFEIPALDLILQSDVLVVGFRRYTLER